MCYPFAAAAKIRAKVWHRDRVRIRVRVSINNNNLSAAELTDKYHSTTPANARHLAWRIFCRCSIVLLFYLPRKVSFTGRCILRNVESIIFTLHMHCPFPIKKCYLRCADRLCLPTTYKRRVVSTLLVQLLSHLGGSPALAKFWVHSKLDF